MKCDGHEICFRKKLLKWKRLKLIFVTSPNIKQSDIIQSNPRLRWNEMLKRNCFQTLWNTCLATCSLVSKATPYTANKGFFVKNSCGNFVFKFEFIVHLQTIKFIVKWDMRKKKGKNLFLFWILFDTNFSCAKAKYFYSFKRLRGRVSMRKMWKMCRFRREWTAKTSARKNKAKGKIFIELYRRSSCAFHKASHQLKRTRT